MNTSSGRWISVILRICSDSLTATEITQILGLKPSTTNRITISSNETQDIWILDSKLGEQGYLDNHITEILNLIKDKKSQLWKIEESSEISIWCAFSSKSGQGGFIFSQSILQ